MAKLRDVVLDNLAVRQTVSYWQATSNTESDCWLPAFKKFADFMLN